MPKRRSDGRVRFIMPTNAHRGRYLPHRRRYPHRATAELRLPQRRVLVAGSRVHDVGMYPQTHWKFEAVLPSTRSIWSTCRSKWPRRCARYGNQRTADLIFQAMIADTSGNSDVNGASVE